MPTFARVQLHLPLDQSFAAQAISLACMIVLIPIFGALVVYLALTYPLFSWLNENPSFLNLAIVQVALCSVLGVFFGPLSTAFAEQFPAHVRSTALAIAYNVSVKVFGGFAQFFVTWLIATTGSPVAPAFYVLFDAAVGLLAALFLKDRAREARLAVTDVAEANVA
jgi:MFS transporter, MHS family, proline/betaine transporter